MPLPVPRRAPACALLLGAASPILAQAPSPAPGAPGASSFAARTLDPRTMRPAARRVVLAGGTSVPLQGNVQPAVEVRVDGQGTRELSLAATTLVP